jgi:hypothetical protein
VGQTSNFSNVKPALPDFVIPDRNDLRVVELVIESLKRKNKTSIIKTSPAEYPFQEVIRLMGISPLNAEDIELGRQERI